MRLSQLDIAYFRSLFSISLTFKPLTIIIGPNASGKSNLFKAIRFLYDGVAGDRRDWQAYHSQIDDLVWYGYKEHYGTRADEVIFSLKFDNPKANYLIDFEVSEQTYLSVQYESLSFPTPTPNDPFQKVIYFDQFAGRSTKYIGHRGKPLKHPQSTFISERSLYLREYGSGFTLPEAKSVYDHITGWRFVDVEPAKGRQSSFIPAVPEEVPPLEGDGSNLSAFLYALNKIRYDDFVAISEEMANLIELPQKMLVEHDAERGGSQARYGFVEAPFGENRLVPPASMSDGTIRLLALLSFLMGDRTASLLCLEEPDHGLHPRLMHYLADVLRRAVSPIQQDNGQTLPTPQIIITTHSAELMDCFDLEAEADYLQVYIAERDEEGKTVFTSSSAQMFAPWLKRYRLGEAVRRRFV